MSEPSVSRQHTVTPGDCTASIADSAGLPWQTVWELAENKPLKELRKNPFTLLTGDVVTVPPPQLKHKDCATDKKHKFVVKTAPIHIRLRVLDEKDKPFANQPFKLQIDGVNFSGQTDGNGRLEQEISPSAKEGWLLVGGQEKWREYYLKLGHVPPIDTTQGAQARLYDLGYYDGETNGEWNGQTRSALMIFQMKYKLPVTGSYDQTTQDKLKEVFGS
jgi:hypothetical protein